MRSALLQLIYAVASDNIDLDRIKPLLKAAFTDTSTDEQIWELVDLLATESTPLPRAITSSSSSSSSSSTTSIQQTLWLHNTSSFANSSEYRQDVDKILKSVLGPLEGDNALFANGWNGWPKDASQEDVLSWLVDLIEKLATFSADKSPGTAPLRRPLAQPQKPIQGSTGERKLDIEFVSVATAAKDTRCQWSQIIIPGQLKSNPAADTAAKAWLDLGRYAREVLAAQDTRRYVLGFTLCESVMRIWAFDRLGGVASEQFDINEDGLHFVSTILGFMWMSETVCGFDPTITIQNGRRMIEIERNGQTERLVLDSVLERAPCIAGRATTCWKAYRETDPQIPLVVKDSWQYTERDEEGELLQEATERGVINVARYYHHSTVRVRGQPDDVRDNIRGGLDIRTARNYRPERSALLIDTSAFNAPRKGRNGGRTGTKRSSSQTGASLPPTKRSYSASSTKLRCNSLPNRVHLRVIVRDFGKPIYKASSHTALLAALEGCIVGHQSLQRAGILHRDVSINNLMINENQENPSWPSFPIDLDLAIKEQRVSVTGASGKTGTRAFMAIGSLLGEKHSFMHDLESFFWVFFWICIHYEGSGVGRVVGRFDKWNYADTEELAGMKKGEISDEADFVRFATDCFTVYYQPLISCANALRKVVFPHGRRWSKEDPGLYSRMTEILRGAQTDMPQPV
ncbi:hypothetical protein POX_h09539 [Penicillium oxalicum]|uniref:hypothetical protein n=1 Tax=Penicillium oxalicum TaxID=69781 RepID=UPI0020B78172|nr:hypothetical protein POX_h09539 [Penicillium oxalicum]KAI2785780.1 hypothetical protein POX_h09539 [Penicillium oxalicum]